MGVSPETGMRKAMLSLVCGACLAWMASSPAHSETGEMKAVLRGFDSATWRFQLADIVGTLLAIKREGAGECAFKIDDAQALELNAWLEQPSTEITDTSVDVERRDQVERIMGALLMLDPDMVCKSAREKIPASLANVLHR